MASLEIKSSHSLEVMLNMADNPTKGYLSAPCFFHSESKNNHGSGGSQFRLVWHIFFL